MFGGNGGDYYELNGLSVESIPTLYLGILGWSSAIGRMTAIIAPILIGGLLGMSLPAYFNFMAVALIMDEDESEKISVNDPALAKA